MAFFDWLRSGSKRTPARAATQSSSGGVLINSPDELAEAFAMQLHGTTGAVVNTQTAMTIAAVFACIRVRAGAVANMPTEILREFDDGDRERAKDHPLWNVFKKRPNRWQTPSQFKRMMEAHLLLRGNAFALIVRSRGRVIELVPLSPDQVSVEQGDDLKVSYIYTRKDGRKISVRQEDMFHLVGLSLDGVRGVSVITYARNTIGLALSQENFGAQNFKNGARPSTVMKHPGKLGPEGLEFLRSSMEQYRSGGENEGKTLILEEGMSIEPISMTAADSQWLGSREFTRTEIAMFFGVPPHMIGDTGSSSNWGTGLEQQGRGFVTYTLEDSLVTWEEAIGRDLIAEDDVYARFNRKSLVRGDLATRTSHYVSMLQWGVYSPNEVRAAEDMNAREAGDVYYEPPNAPGGAAADDGGDPGDHGSPDEQPDGEE